MKILEKYRGCQRIQPRRLDRIIVFLFPAVILAGLIIIFACKKRGGDLELKPEEGIMIRPPVVAGAFYPADKEDLEKQLGSFLTKAQKTEEKEKLRILIVPHAGYDYSGPTAAWGFKQLENQEYNKIIILGVSHRVYFSHAAVYHSGGWQTPLGQIEIDEALASALINQSEDIKADLQAHGQEHSLEVEIPFIQYLLKNFKIVPVLLGQINDELRENLSQTIADNFDEQTLLVVSTDLSHYPPYETAKRVDHLTIDAILSGEINKLEQVVRENEAKEGVDTCACGADAVKTAMLTARKLSLASIKLLHYSNSGDTGGDQSRVVGYAAIGFYGKIAKKQIGKQELNQSQQKQLLQLGRETLELYLKDKTKPKPEIEDEALKEKLGAFVTLRTKTGQLRGCIGEFNSQKPLYQVIQDKAIDAALNDPRFPPVKYEELKDINIEVSVLSSQEKISDWQKIELGKHGVVIKKGLRGGTFLPQVANETGWDLEKFLANLCSSKAGLPANCYQDSGTQIFIFTAQVFSEEE